MRYRIAFLLAMSLAATTLCAQKMTEKFIVNEKGQKIGTEEYSVTRSPNQYKLKSRSVTRLATGQNAITEQELLLTPDLSLKRYSLRTVDPNGIRTIEAERDKDKILMTARLPDTDPRSLSVPATPGIFLLDNMVVSQYQVLLDGIAGNPPAPSYGFLVPRGLSLLPGGVTELPRQEKGTLSGQPITLRKYSINCGGLVVETWADTATNKLMRVWVPTQQIEFIREGYVTGTAMAVH